jgi:hypothetical protein
LDEYLVQGFKTSESLARGIWIIPDWMFIPIPEQVGLEEGGIDFEELNWKPKCFRILIVRLK